MYVPTGPVRRLGPGGTAAVTSQSAAMAPPAARPHQASRPSGTQVRDGLVLREALRARAGVGSPGLGGSEAGNRSYVTLGGDRGGGRGRKQIDKENIMKY